jgi:DNA-binding MarR family transcriptional regulator
MPPVPKKARSVRQNAIEAVNHCAAHQVRIAARQITRFLDARMRTTGLGIEQFNLLTEIAASETDSLAAIARSACIAKSTLTRNLQVLEKAGLVEIASDAAKPRVRMVSLTEKGVLTLEKAMPAWRSASAVLSRFVDFDLPKKLAAQSRRISVRRGG